MKQIFRFAFLILAWIQACPAALFSQGLYQVTTEEKINCSSLIVEGKVTSQRSYWNDRKTMIYTASTIEIYKVFKGSTTKHSIEVVTQGGAVGNYFITASHLLKLTNGDLGMFFCAPGNNGLYRVYSSDQGFIRYDLVSKKGHAPFVQYDDIEKSLYKELTERTGRAIQNKNSAFSVDKASAGMIKNNSTLAPVISSFSPTTVNAGALLDPENNVLTITGTGFGAYTGDAGVLFSDADKGPGNFELGYDITRPVNSPIISWTDNQIRVAVPSRAGTGPFRVLDKDGNFVTSSTDLNVRYSILTAHFDAPYGTKQFNLGNKNGSGGYTVKYSTSTANSGINFNTSPARGTFVRAMNTWKESTGANLIEGGTTTLQVVNPDDGENIVMFDNEGSGREPLEAGVLATTVSGIEICPGNPTVNQAAKSGFDIIVRNSGVSEGNTSFTLGPCPPYTSASSVVDLESVLLHELGHALNLGHTVEPIEGSGAGTANPAKVMHYSVSFNQRRLSIDYSAKAGVAYQITPHGRTYGTCSDATPEMVPLAIVAELKDSCPVNFPASTTSNNSEVNFDLVHATSNKLEDPAYNQMTLNGVGTNVTNTAFYPIRTNSNGGDLSINVSDYTTNPAEIANCQPGRPEPTVVTGVKLSMYKVNGCPNGGEYPTPIVYNVFDGDGDLPQITALEPSANYLLVLDGIQNTKANFNLNFSGSALVQSVTQLEGVISGDFNDLSWTTDTLFGISSMKLERSPDGITFAEIHNIPGSDEQRAGQFTDDRPLSGNNYYRIAIGNVDGTTQYSQVVLLARGAQLTVQVFNSGSVEDQMIVRINSNEASEYGLTLQNVLGQVLVRRKLSLQAGSQTIDVPVGALARGVYYLSLFGKDNKRVSSVTVRLR